MHVTSDAQQTTQGFLPKEMVARHFVADKIRAVFQNFGYDAIGTPAICYTEQEDPLYDFAQNTSSPLKDKKGQHIVLNWDHTIPFARFMSQHLQVFPLPFKCYQMGRVFRPNTRAQGRYQECYQCDVDIIGTTCLLAEAEIVRVIDQVFKALRFKDYIIRFNSMRLVDRLFAHLGIPDKGRAATLAILRDIAHTGQTASSDKLVEITDKNTAHQLMGLVLAKDSQLKQVAALCKDCTKEITEFLALANACDVAPQRLAFDVTLAGELNYYTGIIYQVFLPQLPVGCIATGGRYDTLCAQFSDKALSGTGVSFDFDKIMHAIQTLGLMQDIPLHTRVLVAHPGSESLATALAITRTIQTAGICTEIYLVPKKIRAQLAYAQQKNIPFVVILKKDALQNAQITLKLMHTGKEKIIPQSQVVPYLQGYIT